MGNDQSREPMPPWPNLSLNADQWQDPLRSFNEGGMGGLNRDVYDGGAQQSRAELGKVNSSRQVDEDEHDFDEPESEGDARSRTAMSTHSSKKSVAVPRSVGIEAVGKGEDVRKRPEDVRMPPMIALKRSTAKLSKYMTPDAIAQLQMQEQQRAHEVQRRAIEKTFNEKTKTQSAASTEQMRLKEAIRKARETAFLTNEYRTHSSQLFVGYNNFVKNR